MAFSQQKVPFPLITLESGDTVTVEAISPTTGAVVTGVTISLFTVYVRAETVDVAAPADNPLPVWAPIPVEAQSGSGDDGALPSYPGAQSIGPAAG